MKRPLAALLAASALFAAPRADALINGSSTLAPLFPEVVRLRTSSSMCSGTIVGPRAIVTAKHCVTSRPTSIAYGGQHYSLRFFVSSTDDLAVGVTDRDIRAARFATIGGAVERGDAVHLLGYGCTLPRGGGRAGELRLGSSRVVDTSGPYIVSRSTDGGTLCYGDSGGPAFVREDGRRLLVGVNSRGDIRTTNIDVDLGAPRSQAFLRKVAERGVAICGIDVRCPQHA
jgi:hypothetical protein